MDLRVFYQKVRQVETQIRARHAVVVSLETADGGQPGVMTEVQREQAARLVVEGRARLASAEEAEKFRADVEESYRSAEELAQANKLQVTVVSDAVRTALKPKK